jgi:small subunit ribosomal protein S15
MKEEDSKKDLIRFFGRDPTDTGSPEVQIALLTKRIKALRSLHFKFHRKDKHSFLGLRMLISKKEKLLKYLGWLNANRYSKMIEHLGPSIQTKKKGSTGRKGMRTTTSEHKKDAEDNDGSSVQD